MAELAAVAVASAAEVDFDLSAAEIAAAAAGQNNSLCHCCNRFASDFAVVGIAAVAVALAAVQIAAGSETAPTAALQTY